jgi:hypothetical protein
MKLQFKPVHPHYFADQQFCMKCGKWEGAPEEGDCIVSHEDFETLRMWEVLKSERIRLRETPEEWLAVLRKYVGD